MLQYVPTVCKAVEGLGLVVKAESSLFRMAIRHWPVTGLVLTAWGTQLYRRWKHKELTAYTAMVDSGAIIGPAVSLMLLAKLSRDHEETVLAKQAAPVENTAAPGPTAVDNNQAAIQGYFDSLMKQGS